jgi:FAD/FMN-containing dehydrogenase
MVKKSARKIILYSFLFIFCLGLVFIARPLYHVLNVKSSILHDSLPGVPAGYADDVSRLNITRVDTVILVDSDRIKAVQQLAGIIRYARINAIPVSIAGARHSMGGHTIAADGIVINMLPFKHMQLDTVTNVLTVGAGAKWSDVIPYLNEHGRAVAIMQSDNAFSVGGSVSVNCHGWQHNMPPIASTVLSLRLLNPAGEIEKCSLNENAELFSLVLGGYGLFGIILEVDLATVPNEMYAFRAISMPSGAYTENYGNFIDGNKEVRMVFGRLSVSRDYFLEEARLNYFVRDTTVKKMPDLSEPGFLELKRSIFMGTKDDDYGKKLRWNMEGSVSKLAIGKKFSRNQIMNEDPSFYLNRSEKRTDILHEYFIPRRNFNAFVKALQRVVPAHKCDLLNVTLRNVYRDEITYLKYAREEVFAFVMFFDQAKTPEAEEEMQKLTMALVNESLELEGTYYLPYRLHPSQEQLAKAYPMAKDFFERKRQYDSLEIFRNKFYDTYGQRESAGH